MAAAILPVCVICGKVPDNGMHDGIYIKGKFICSACETTICGLSAGNVNYLQVVKDLQPIVKSII